MALALLHLAITGLLGTVAPGGASPPPAAALPSNTLASTYDQASCATIHGVESDDWDRAAIGEDAPAPDEECPVTVAGALPPPRLDCNDPLSGRWFTDTIGTCATPKNSGIPQAGVKAARSESRRKRAMVELAGNETMAPLAPPPDERPPAPAHVVAPPTLKIPTSYVLLTATTPAALRSISGDELLRPPRA